VIWGQRLSIPELYVFKVISHRGLLWYAGSHLTTALFTLPLTSEAPDALDTVVACTFVLKLCRTFALA
jgi:hypothetical protein